MTKITLNQQTRKIDVAQFVIENEIVFDFFDKLSGSEREEKLYRALYIGVLALAEDRLSAFLSKTQNELGTELESLKLRFDMKQELFFKSATTGIVAEEAITEILGHYFTKQGFKDTAQMTGNTAGLIPRNKTGDIVCNVDGREDVKIIVECKFDKSLKLGDIKEKEIFTKSSDTAWSQLIEANANRGGKVAIIVFDVEKVDPKILNTVQNVKYIPEIGFITIVKSQSNDYSNLMIAYAIARDIALSSQKVDLDRDLMTAIINRIIKDLGDMIKIEDMVRNNITQNKEILKQLEKSRLMMEFNREYLLSFLQEGTMSKQDLLAFYTGDAVKDRYKPIEKEIESL
jgi:hypothetical protein